MPGIGDRQRVRRQHRRLPIGAEIRRVHAGLPWLRIDEIACDELLEAIDDDAIMGLHAVENMPFVLVHAAEPDRRIGAVVLATK